MICVEKKIVLSYPREEIWKIVTDLSDWKWRSDLSKIEVCNPQYFIEYTKKNIPTHFHITDKKANEYYRFTIENDHIKGVWTGTFLALEPNKTEFILLEELEINRFIMKLLSKPYLKKQQKQYIDDLEKKLKEIKR